ncbi:sugar kinase [Olivibacter sp. SDN3]|nr:sugar kinase [Olivibacter sp. SDN3]
MDKRSNQRQNAYLVIDIGTGNVRVASVLPTGNILCLKRENVHYEKDTDYPDAIFFSPDRLWQQIIEMTQQVLQDADNLNITAITATSQREGVVVLDEQGKALIGMSNHDNRGREWEHLIKDKSAVYATTGRYPTALFSALKLVGLRERKKAIWQKAASFTSISDWVEFMFCDTLAYEHSQASETLLYDIKKGHWSEDLCKVFNLPFNLLPPLVSSGSIKGRVRSAIGEILHMAPDTLVVTGGSDTQVAIKSVAPTLDDVVIVSGTTTPIVKLINTYTVDEKERTWTNRHIDSDTFILEANAGVTGLNYQRLKEIFYPNEDYAVIENELTAISYHQCMASLGSLLADEKSPLTKGGFIFHAPVSHQLTRGDFVWAILWDIACSIYENYKTLCSVRPHTKNYILACGGGVQSRTLRRFLAHLLNKDIIIRDTYWQSSVVGGAFLCNQALNRPIASPNTSEKIVPQDREQYLALYQEWQQVRNTFKKINT